MNAKNIKPSKTVRYNTLDDIPAAPPLSPRTKSLSDVDIAAQASTDPDMGLLTPEFWDKADIVEPEGTEQITLRLPRRVVKHFKATGKGYQSRISAVLQSYVDASNKKKAG